jgi:phytoene desaturase
MGSVIVIGTGIGGIAAAGRLARAGYDVKVFEQAAAPGGRTAVIERDGYRFDTGPTLFLMPEVFAETYAAFGVKMEDHLDLVRIDPTYRVHFHDGAHIDLSSNLVAMREQLEALEPGSFEAYLRFMAEGYRHYNLSLQKFVGRNFYTIFDFLNLSNLPLLFQLKALIKHAANTRNFFKDSRLQAAFSFQNMYLGLSPYDAPATFSLLQYTELADGVWFPRGGMYQAIQSLEKVAAGLGAQFTYNTPVARINVEQERATGVTLENGEFIPADFVVANADLPYVYGKMLPDDGSYRKLAGRKYTSSAIMFYWAVRGEKSDQLLHHNVFLADHQYKASFDRIFNDLTLPDEPSFYVNAVARTDPTSAPEDGDSIMALVPVGHLNDAAPQDWPTLEERARSTVMKRLKELGVGSIAERLVFEEKWGPPYYQKALNLEKGAAFGLSHNFLQVGYFRPHNRHAHYKNLYFAGASTHPGTGLPIVLLSARLTVERMLKEWPAPDNRPVFQSVPFLGKAG